MAVVQAGAGFPKEYQGRTDGGIPFYKVSDMSLPGNERWMTWANNAVTEQVRRSLGAGLFPPGSIIFPKIGGAIATNKKRQTTRECCVDNNVMGVIPRTDRILGDYLFYFFQAHDLSGFANEAHLPSIRKTEVEAHPIHVPDSLAEQRAIVEFLDRACEGIAIARANADRNRQNARAVFRNHLDAIFSQQGREWVEKRLEQAVSETCTLSYGIVQPGGDYPNGVPVVRPMDLTTKVIPLDGLKRIDPSLADAYTRTCLRGGELLLCVRGSTGVVSVASSELAGANVTRGIVPIRFDPADLSQDFGYYLLSSGEFQKEVREKTYGAALMQINLRDLRGISISFPSREEQAAIVARLDELSSQSGRLESTYERKISVLDELNKALLQEAVSGQLETQAA